MSKIYYINSKYIDRVSEKRAIQKLKRALKRKRDKDYTEQEKVYLSGRF